MSRVLFGHQATLLPKWDEDFSIALLRVGTVSLEASCVLGLGHEVGGVAAIIPIPLDQHGSVELNRFGVASVCPAVEGFGRHRRFKKGFSNEIKTVRATSNEGNLWLDMVWYRELARFGVGVVRCVRGFIMFSWSVLRWRSRSPSFRSQSIVERGEVESEPNRAQGTKESEEELYARFVRGDPMHDDDEDDEEFEYRRSEIERDGSASPTSSTSGDDGDEYGEGLQDANETVSLFSDLSSSPSGVASASILLAHMTDNSPSPMTRRRFRHLVPAPSRSSDSLLSDWTDVAAANRRSISSGTRMPEDSVNEVRNCVICTVEPRQIICWPCRWVMYDSALAVT